MEHSLYLTPAQDPNAPWTLSALITNCSLPYLSSPCLHFLAFLSPLAYLTLLRVRYPHNPRSITSARLRRPDRGSSCRSKSCPPPRRVTRVTLRVQDLAKPRSDMDDTMMFYLMGPPDVVMEFKYGYPQVPITTVLSWPTKPV